MLLRSTLMLSTHFWPMAWVHSSSMATRLSLMAQEVYQEILLDALIWIAEFYINFCIQICCIMYLGIICFIDIVSKWCTFFKYYLLISFVCFSCCCIYSCYINCCGSHHKDLNLALESWVWLEYKLTCYMFHVHHHSPQSSSFFREFRRLNLNLYEFLSKFLIFWYSILTIYIYNYNNENSLIICCCLSDDIYFFFCIGCEDVSSICAANLLGSSRVVF